MPRRRNGRKRKRAAAGSGVDYIGALQDELIEHVLSFLPAHEVVRSCVLSRRWRHLWRSVPVLRITGANSWGRPVNFNNFVNRLLLLRGPSPLHEFEFETYTYMPQMLSNVYSNSKEPVRYVELWIAHAINCDVRVLRVLVRSMKKPLLLVEVPLTARHLTTLELQCLVLDNRALDFLRCPALEDLKINYCRVTAHKLSSQSLKRLCITSCDFEPYTFRTQISSPGLVLLQMRNNRGWTPVLESMPLLVTASVRLGGFDSRDNSKEHSYCRDCHSGACLKCYGKRDGSDKSVVLKGLSNATNLELGAEDGVRIFKLDMAWCPTFSKLKTLVLNGWVVGCDFLVLLCFLQHAPILEKLSLRLYEANELMTNMEENCSPMEQLLPSENLKIVEVRCMKVDERVHNFLRILSIYGVSPDKISIQTTNSRFS